MKVGYMRPMYDLEEDVPGSDNAQLTSYVARFVANIVKYKGPAAACIIYAGGNFTTQVNAGSGLENLPLWYPNYNIDGNWSAANPSSGTYGPWDDAGDPQPWAFWQHYSPDAYVPGVPGASTSNLTHNDLDVAHNDINFVRQNYAIQGAIWQPAGSSTWANASNWSTAAIPNSSTEVLLDLGFPVTITLAAGQSASGVYFADNFTLSGGSLSLSDGRIDVDSGKTGTLQTSLSARSAWGR
jgi:hypothetical protein